MTKTNGNDGGPSTSGLKFYRRIEFRRYGKKQRTMVRSGCCSKGPKWHALSNKKDTLFKGELKA